jgi:hypothetical protein
MRLLMSSTSDAPGGTIPLSKVVEPGSAPGEPREEHDPPRHHGEEQHRRDEHDDAPQDRGVDTGSDDTRNQPDDSNEPDEKLSRAGVFSRTGRPPVDRTLRARAQSDPVDSEVGTGSFHKTA